MGLKLLNRTIHMKSTVQLPVQSIKFLQVQALQIFPSDFSRKIFCADMTRFLRLQINKSQFTFIHTVSFLLSSHCFFLTRVATFHETNTRQAGLKCLSGYARKSAAAGYQPCTREAYAIALGRNKN
jgi:hypothetical protein